MSTLEGIVTSRTATPRVHGWSPIQNELMALLLSVLCNDTDFRLINNLGDDPCPHDHHSTSQSVVHYGMVSLKEEAGATTKFNYTSWAFSFPILSIDVQYMEMATEQARTFNDEISLLDGLNIMQQVAQEALDLRLKVARHSLSKGTYVSVTGEEQMTFERKNTEGHVIEMSNDISSFHPNPLHTLRFAGIVLLCITVVAYLALIRLSNRRRLAREWESERIKEAKGGLITEPGLDYILDKGKKSGIFCRDTQNLLPEIS
eukprot:CAMPEP_0202449084 /NCGR_PEP_ID=MMETSP1360-20130828/7846_1 /ASSEMBLY_ACC=CAM_ASM_000848 /TAXON_ID=515479 /ORGANISM="Licmophora paradoxa, Strain CCMP2313" /LENGTH=259 /DNA_ID=CAMNT_0049066901 /DNA_START=175 /DNA_END=954 /DNA_ORIENTATION=-